MLSKLLAQEPLKTKNEGVFQLTGAKPTVYFGTLPESLTPLTVIIPPYVCLSGCQGCKRVREQNLRLQKQVPCSREPGKQSTCRAPLNSAMHVSTAESLQMWFNPIFPKGT